MRIATEIIGLFIISLIMMAVPVLCALSFAYNWYGLLKVILVIACVAEWTGLLYLLTEASDD